MFDAARALDIVLAFDEGEDGLAAKSKELICNLLRHTQAPFSRDQFHPGHITCTALVLSPDASRVLLMLHYRHRRWLLPGGHVEDCDASLAETAQREAIEETGASLSQDTGCALVGMDVHAIPARKDEPYHLHHDLVFSMKAKSLSFHCTEEAPHIVWCGPDEFDAYQVPLNIVRSFQRVRRA